MAGCSQTASKPPHPMSVVRRQQWCPYLIFFRVCQFRYCCRYLVDTPKNVLPIHFFILLCVEFTCCTWNAAFTLGNIYGMERHFGVLGEAFIAGVGIIAQNCASLFYAFANGICNIGLPNPSKRGHAQIYPRIYVLGYDDSNLIIAYAPFAGLATPFPWFSVFDLHTLFRPEEESLITFSDTGEVIPVVRAQ